MAHASATIGNASAGASGGSRRRWRMDRGRRQTAVEGRDAKRLRRFRAGSAAGPAGTHQARPERLHDVHAATISPRVAAVDGRGAGDLLIICRPSQRITLLRTDADPIGAGGDRLSDFVDATASETTVGHSGHRARAVPPRGGFRPLERGHSWGHGWGRAGATHRWGAYS
jgi:hypothetical protein